MTNGKVLTLVRARTVWPVLTLVLSLLTPGSQLSRIKVQLDKEDAAQLLLAADVQCPLAGSLLTIVIVSATCLQSRSRKLTG